MGLTIPCFLKHMCFIFFFGGVICFKIALIYADFCRLRTLPGYQKRTLPMSLELVFGITAVVNTVVNILGEIWEWYQVKNKKKED